MNAAKTHRLLATALTLVGAFVVTGGLPAVPPAPPAASHYAPIDDLVAQIGEYAESLESSADIDPADYSEIKQASVRKSAGTLAALAMVLANHNAQTPWKGRGAAIFTSAKSIAAGAGDLDKTKGNVAALLKAVEGSGETNGGTVAWQTVADMESLMKSVSTLNSRLKRGVKGSKLEKSADRTTGYSVALAAIGQAIMTDDSYASSTAELAQWQEFCGLMRDAAGELNAAIHKQDEAAVEAAMTRLKLSCDKCHEVFEIDE